MHGDRAGQGHGHAAVRGVLQRRSVRVRRPRALQRLRGSRWNDSMSEMQDRQRSAVVFGARNLGRAVIELLVSDDWAVTGVARSQSTLDGVSAAGALAVKADVTDPTSVYGVLEQS